MSDDPNNPNWDGTPEWVRGMMTTLERFMPAAGVAFTITRDELHAHFEERAAHWRSEAELLREGGAKLGQTPPAGTDPKLVKALTEAQIDQARRTSQIFAFMASHLSDNVKRFTIDMSTAMAYELVPHPFTSNLGALAQYDGSHPLPPLPATPPRRA